MKKDLPFLEHIRDEINFIITKTQKLSFEDFIIDESLKRDSARSPY